MYSTSLWWPPAGGSAASRLSCATAMRPSFPISFFRRHIERLGLDVAAVEHNLWWSSPAAAAAGCRVWRRRRWWRRGRRRESIWVGPARQSSEACQVRTGRRARWLRALGGRDRQGRILGVCERGSWRRRRPTSRQRAGGIGRGVPIWRSMRREPTARPFGPAHEPPKDAPRFSCFVFFFFDFFFVFVFSSLNNSGFRKGSKIQKKLLIFKSIEEPKICP